MNLTLGQKQNGRAFELPIEAVVEKFAILAISGAGKTCTATVMAEEFCKAKMPWIALDPTGVWWGLRATPEGKPGGYPVVVFGGPHADLPLERGSGKRIAEALLEDPVFAVIDLKRESKTVWRQVVMDICLTLLDHHPEIPRHIFIEEAPDFVPQKAKFALTAACKEAVERLVRTGRNDNYGATLISQRPATVDKDVLSQCGNLIVLRTSGTHDRKALKEWVEGNAPESGVEKFIDGLASLENGAGWFWSPHWLKTFERIRIRQRSTFHPGETWTAGKMHTVATLSDVGEFVERLKKQLTAKSVHMTDTRGHPSMDDSIKRGRRDNIGITHESPRPSSPSDTSAPYRQTIEMLERDNLALKKELVDLRKRMDSVKKILEPQYNSLKTLFGEMGNGSQAGIVDRVAYDQWLQKAGKAGTKRLLETMIEKNECTRTQLATLSGLSLNTGTFRNYLSWLRRNGLIETDGDIVRLKPL